MEAAWGARYFPDSRPKSPTDVFGAAYPYENRAQVIEAYGERTFRPGGGLVGVRAGRFRTPFGISTRSDHAYGGFMRAPMIRYDNYFALSNNFLEHGADVIVGAPQAYFEASVGRPSDVGEVQRRPGFDTVLRGQAYYRSAIVGVSHYRAMPYQPEYFAKGRAVFTGVDVRWMYNGIQLRGEFLSGRPFDGTTTTGGYVDLLVHRVGMGPVTAVARLERLDYDTIPRVRAVCAPRDGGCTHPDSRRADGADRGGPPVASADSAGPHGVRLRHHLLAPPRYRHTPAVSAPAPPPVIPWHRRLEARLALSVGLLVAVSLGAALTMATRVAMSRSLMRASENMHAAQTAFERLVETRAEAAAAQTRLITGLPVFRSHITEVSLASDAAEMNVMADDYRQQLKARFTIVTNRRGVWLANPGWPGGEVDPAVANGIRDAMAGRAEPRQRVDRRRAVSHRVGAGEVRRGSPRHHDGGVRHRRRRRGRSRRRGARRSESRRRRSPGRQQSARRAARGVERPASARRRCAISRARRRTWRRWPATATLREPFR